MGQISFMHVFIRLGSVFKTSTYHNYKKNKYALPGSSPSNVFDMNVNFVNKNILAIKKEGKRNTDLATNQCVNYVV